MEFENAQTGADRAAGLRLTGSSTNTRGPKNSRRPGHRSTSVTRLVAEAKDESRCAVSRTRAEEVCLLRAKTAGKLVTPMPRLYTEPAYWSDLKPDQKAAHVIKALHELHPDWVFAGPSAALVLGLSVSYDCLWPIRIATEERCQVRNSYIQRQSVGDCAQTTTGGITTTSLERTAFDCLREMSFPDGLAVADSLLREYDLQVGWLLRALGEFPHTNAGWTHAMETAVLASPLAESGGESVARARMILLGYELPYLQVAVPNKVDGGMFYADFGWDRGSGQWILGELDGQEKYVNPQMTGGAASVDVLRAERLRESRMTAHNVPVARFSYADMMSDWRFGQILDAFGVPKARTQIYQGKGTAYQPRQKAACLKALREYGRQEGSADLGLR